MRTRYTLALILAGTILGLAGTDLVLPAIPSLPQYLSGNLAQAQFVLASFTLGSAAGLLFFGAIGARYSLAYVLICAFCAYSFTSLLALFATSINELVSYRLLQGFASAAPAVFAPAIIRAVFNEHDAIKALGIMGGIESMVPALAPVLGAWLLLYFDWRASFVLIALLAALLALLWFRSRDLVPTLLLETSGQGYLPLLRKPDFLRFTLSQAFSLGGLLVFVFGAPTVFVETLGGQLKDFVVMQLLGISFYVLCAYRSAHLASTYGHEFIIGVGSSISAIGFFAIFAYSLFGGASITVVTALFIIANAGFGLRGPAGFYQAIVASKGDDTRGAALIILFILLFASMGTIAVAPWIEIGLTPLSGVAAVISIASVVCLSLWRGSQNSQS